MIMGTWMFIKIFFFPHENWLKHNALWSIFGNLVSIDAHWETSGKCPGPWTLELLSWTELNSALSHDSCRVFFHTLKEFLKTASQQQGWISTPTGFGICMWSGRRSRGT